MKSYVPQLLDDFAGRMWDDAFLYYGWDEVSLRQSIARNLQNAELKAVADKLTEIKFDAEKVLNTILDGKTQQEIKGMDLPVFEDELTVVAKEPSTWLANKTYLPGMLAFYDENTGEYYVINDTSAKNKNGRELEMDDKTTVGSVLAYNGLNDGNPLHKFATEQLAREYYDEKLKSIRSVKANDGYCEEAVINSVLLEFGAYKQDLLSKSQSEVFEKSYKTHLFNEFGEVIQYGKEYLSEKEFQALYEDRGHILQSLYDDYIDCENYSVETYADTATFIKDYCEAYHHDLYYPITFYGKDTEDRAYYSMTQGITFETLNWLDINADADMITVAAPECDVSKDELDKRHIFYLNIGRDIQADELEGPKAIRNMMNAMDNYKRIYPLYLQTGKYAREHCEIIAHRNSRKANIECKLAIEDAIRNNFDGMHLGEGIEDKIIEQYGMERVAFVVANTVNEHNWDGRFGRENKEWAKTIPMSEDENVRNECCLTTHPAILNGFADRIRKQYIKKEKNNEMEQDKLKNTMTQEKYGFENTEDPKKKYVKFKISPEALIRKYPYNSRFMMPKDSGYAGCAYSVFNDRISESTITTDINSDTRERALEIRLPENSKVEIYNGEEKIIDFPAREFAEMVDGTTADKYEREARVTIGFPQEAILKDLDSSLLIAVPNDSEYKGYVYYLPKSLVNEDKERDDGSLIASVGENFKVTLRKGEEQIEFSAKEFSEVIKDSNNYERKFVATDENGEPQDRDEKKWQTVSLSEKAVIKNKEDSTVFKMPKGEYAGFVYYIPSGMVKKDENGLSLRIPEGFMIHLKDGDKSKDLSAEEFIAAVGNKTDDDYAGIYRKPSEEMIKQFEKAESRLRKNVPEEMLKKPNWVVVRTRENNGTGRLDKFLIDPHMSLMNYLAFWSNHDIDQMLRIFATSKLYRPEKEQSYYEHKAIIAVKSTPVYTPPKASNNKPSENESGKDGK